MRTAGFRVAEGGDDAVCRSLCFCVVGGQSHPLLGLRHGMGAAVEVRSGEAIGPRLVWTLFVVFFCFVFVLLLSKQSIMIVIVIVIMIMILDFVISFALEGGCLVGCLGDCRQSCRVFGGCDASWLMVWKLGAKCFVCLGRASAAPGFRGDRCRPTVVLFCFVLFCFVLFCFVFVIFYFILFCFEKSGVSI